jgi:hypothetical protein
MQDYASRAEVYRNKAEKARAVAEGMKDPGAKKMMSMVAQDYEHMARTMDDLAKSLGRRS